MRALRSRFVAGPGPFTNEPLAHRALQKHGRAARKKGADSLDFARPPCPADIAVRPQLHPNNQY
ncbi:hypothetical protein BSIN_0318 [Burkholderia singularis]|uniref:Uncharacterized protein n=1 Tax=Burkholderia singularis TaxID=1503053 RepID=A0A238H591_9BURK|nr:hypothetical protein BSIN_0318 [Burkholderia singularis]